MAILINFFDNVILQAISEEIVPKVSFFKDRYFPTGAGDIFKANEVLTEYRSGDRKLAAFVDQKAGDIPIGRRSYEVHSYKPAYIAPSRLLTLDELTKRGFGEALYPGMDEAQRAARLLADDMNDMENRIARREEWMAAETMIGNGCVMQEYIDGATKGDSLVVKFYDGTSDHTYTASKKWNENGGDFWGDVKAMCRMLSARGLPAKDLILGTDVADYILTDERTRQLLDKNSGIIVGEIRQQLTQYDGVVFMGTLNFGGFMLNVFSVDETYEDETGKSARYFPATAAMVTAPDCGHMYYPFDLAPSFWEQLEEKLKDGSVVLLDMVKNEITEGHDELSNWMKSLQGINIIDHRTPEIIEKYSRVLGAVQSNTCYKQSALAEWSRESVADPWLIATAAVRKLTIVTFEKKNGGLSPKNPSKNAKIPDVAIEFGVSVCDLYYMMRSLSFRL